VRIAIIGRGRLHSAVRQRVAETPIQGEDLSGIDLVLLVTDEWDRELHAKWNELCLATGTALLPAYVEPGKGIVGPLVRPAEPGCLTCAETRRSRARTDLADYVRLLAEHGERITGIGTVWLTPFAAVTMAELVAEEVAALAEGGRPRTAGALVRLKMEGLRSTVHRFLPDPLCARCGTLPDDSEEAAVVRPQPRPKVSIDGYRTRPLDGDKLFRLYVDGEAGLLRAVYKEGRNAFASSSAPMGLRAADRTEVGYGHQLDFRSAQLTAIAEALERYGGIEPGAKRAVVRAGYRELVERGERPLDPLTLGLHTEEQYARPGNHYVRYHADLTFNWVWGYSFRERRPILVPENYAYYGTVYRNTEDHPFVYEISNGCALGACLEEAVLYGILEVAERDAFLMTWYARLPVPRIDPATARDRSLPLVVEGIEHVSGYAIEIFNTTLEFGVPSFWVLAVNQRDDSDLPRVLCTAGSNLDPEKAVMGALLELAPMLSRPAEYYAGQRPRVEEMLADPYAVTSMEDHALVNGAPEAYHRFDFLRRSPDTQSFEEAFKDFYTTPRHPDLLDDLNDVLDRCFAAGVDVIAVDQTTPEQRLADLHCVKVIMPGALPMTFGHNRRRIWGFDRLYRLPHELGYYERPLTDEDVNPDPHPFP
jgi:ribosomal protein S12 methylthiotransferase accessory factor